MLIQNREYGQAVNGELPMHAPVPGVAQSVQDEESHTTEDDPYAVSAGYGVPSDGQVYYLNGQPSNPEAPYNPVPGK